MTIEETPFFFENSRNQRLFAILHEGDNKQIKKNGNTAIIYCHPIFEEKLHSHRVAVNFARFAAKKGFHVFRFDYFGDGESEGLFEDATIASRIADIGAAIEIVRDKVNASKIILLGLRIGATLAILSSCKYADVAGIIAWSPIVVVKSYIQDLLRSNLSSQMVIHKKVLFNRDALVSQILRGKTANVDGYEISKPFFEDAVKIDLTDYICKVPCHLLLIQISMTGRSQKEIESLIKPKAYRNIDFKIVKEKLFWTQQRIVYPGCQELFSVTIDWIKNTL